MPATFPLFGSLHTDFLLSLLLLYIIPPFTSSQKTAKIVNYVFEGKPHEYLPDYVGTLCDGSLLIAEAGRQSEKSKGRALVKAEAARWLAQIKGGVSFIGTDVNLCERRHQNWLYLHARRQPFSTYGEISQALLVSWPYGDMRCVSELVKQFGSHWSEVEVEAAAWKLCRRGCSCWGDC